MPMLRFVLLGAFLPCRDVSRNGRRKRRTSGPVLTASEAARMSDYRLASPADGDSNWIGENFEVPMDAARPDILHQTLMQILDSEANKFGCVYDIIVALDSLQTGRALCITSDFVVPRTYSKFSRCIAAAVQGQLQVAGIHLVEKQRPAGERDYVMGLTVGGRYLNTVDLSDTLKYLMTSVDSDGKIVIAMGVTSHTDPVASGELAKVVYDSSGVAVDYVSVSRMGLTASWAAGKVCEAAVL
ncbi:hypothetical protein FOZ61_007946 [Perkinsus olseni]|uniref:Uncharacterized protein n=1 Tax=Perkinsus olseni TaxID=32597 RepID=A0A7J6M8A6_PEROL|nr:hypothetical protein FOZ61_007946 [Perkinsus olseni]